MSSRLRRVAPNSGHRYSSTFGGVIHPAATVYVSRVVRRYVRNVCESVTESVRQQRNIFASKSIFSPYQECTYFSRLTAVSIVAMGDRYREPSIDLFFRQCMHVAFNSQKPTLRTLTISLEVDTCSTKSCTGFQSIQL